jgi:SAM-dependent methyltransferase
MENITLEKSVLTSMDGVDIDIVKYLPYILQDFWEIGSSPEEIIKIIKKYRSNYSSLNILDLGSGKGAVSIKISSELKCKCFGIDAIDDFVVFSNNKSKEYSVDNICTFETNDIRNRIKTVGKYDIIILGAIGTVFGNYYETLSELTPHLNKGGLIIIDDAYIGDDCNKNYPNTLRESELIKQINNAGMELIKKITVDEISEYAGKHLEAGIGEEYENEFIKIEKRCMELIEKYPDRKELFLDYIEKQKEEYEILSNEIIPSMFVIKQND